MTTLTPAAPVRPADAKVLIGWPVAAGVGLAVGDLVLMTHLAYPWANLANSSAVWALAAFGLGVALRTDPVRAAIAGVVMLVVAVEAYYGVAAVADLAGYRALWSPAAQMWITFAVLAGAVFGAAGAWTASQHWWHRVVGTTIGAGVLLGEAVHVLLNLGVHHLHFRTELQTAVLLAALGVAVLVVSARRPSVIAAAAVLSVPAALVCAAAFTAVGIAY